MIAFFHLRRLRVAVGNAIADMVRSRARKFAHAAALQRATGDHHAGGAPGGLPDDALLVICCIDDSKSKSNESR